MTLREQFKEENNEDAVWEFITCYSDEIQININYLEWLEEKLQNTPSNNKYTDPQATPKSCPKCNDTAIIKYLDDGKYGCENCAYVWA